MDEPFIQTTGCDHLQRRNKLKGTAMQKLIRRAMPIKKDDISIKQILKLVAENQGKYYLVDCPFKVNSVEHVFKHAFVHEKEFPEQDCEVSVREKLVEKKWKVCDNCGQYILATVQKTKKCRKCKKGFFHFKTQKYNKWTSQLKGNRRQAIDWLVDAGHLKPVERELKKRPDCFHYADGVFTIIESKNKEVTGLTFKDLVTSLFPPLVLRDCGYVVRELRLVFNGHFTDELKEQVDNGFAKKFDFDVKFQPVEQFMAENNIKVSKIIVTKEEKRYKYDFVEGENENGLLIDLRGTGNKDALL